MIWAYAIPAELWVYVPAAALLVLCGVQALAGLWAVLK